MSDFHANAVSLALFLYVILGVACFGWGRSIGYILGLNERERCPSTFSIWIGWATILLLLQVIHFALPLNFYIVIPVIIFGIVLSSIFLTVEHRQSSIVSLIRNPAISIAIIVSIIISAWIASRAMLSPTCFDSGLYHFNAINWIKSYHIVPGLGNLHDRLAYNQSFFTYVAALDFHPFFGHGRSIANSFLVILTAATFIELLVPVFKRESHATQSNPLQWGSVQFAFPILAYLTLSSNGLASPTPDLTSCLLQLVIFVIFAHALNDYMAGNRETQQAAIVLGILAATAITIKLSNLVFSASIIVLVLVGVWKTSTVRIRESAVILFTALLIILIWSVRGFVLSGAPFYPSTIGYVPVEWAIPVDQVIDTSNWVYSWARQPQTHWSNVLGSWSWFEPWLLKIATRFTDIIFPLAIFLATCIVNAVTLVLWKSKDIRQHLLQQITVFPLIAGLTFWFFTAPDPRFANALFFLLPVSSILLFLDLIQNRVSGRAFAVITCIVFLICNLNLLNYAYQHTWMIRYIANDGWQGIKQVPLKEKVTEFGLHVFTPVTGVQCWDSALPCTPEFNKALRLRKSFDIASGFTVRSGKSYENDAEQGAAQGGDSAALHPRPGKDKGAGEDKGSLQMTDPH